LICVLDIITLKVVFIFRGLDIGFQIGIGTTVGALEARPTGIDEGANTLVMPNMRAWRHEEGLTWSNRVQTY